MSEADKWLKKNRNPDYLGSVAVVEKLMRGMTPDGRMALLERLTMGYCRECGEKLETRTSRCRSCDTGEEGLALRNAES